MELKKMTKSMKMMKMAMIGPTGRARMSCRSKPTGEQ
jgi:hypothetical protein